MTLSSKDFVTFTLAKLLFDTHFSAIDATIIKRGDNDYVMVLKDNTRQNRNLRISFAKDVHGPWTEPSETFTENFGPSRYSPWMTFTLATQISCSNDT